MCFAKARFRAWTSGYSYATGVAIGGYPHSDGGSKRQKTKATAHRRSGSLLESALGAVLPTREVIGLFLGQSVDTNLH